MFDVAVGACDVDAVRAAVVDVGCAAGAVLLAAYDPGNRRFTSADPEPASNDSPNLSPYTYANNDPIDQDDPSGRCPLCASASIGAAVDGGIYGWQHRNSGGHLGRLRQRRRRRREGAGFSWGGNEAHCQPTTPGTCSSGLLYGYPIPVLITVVIAIQVLAVVLLLLMATARRGAFSRAS
ncbi:hypothetical protein H4K36_00230 [Streptomyces sp. DHE7-1]|nr:hypothetical protein [Streptomyces sp. DHE7-1]